MYVTEWNSTILCYIFNSEPYCENGSEKFGVLSPLNVGFQKLPNFGSFVTTCNDDYIWNETSYT